MVGNTGQVNYGAAKSGIAGFTKVVARDMGRYGVTANSIAPRAQTRMIATIPDIARQGQEDQLPSEQETMDPDDIAPFVAYLASDMADNVNGQTFLVYGGNITLMSQPRRIRTIFKNGRWTLDEISKLAPTKLTQGLVNPSPPQPPRQ